MLNVVTAVSVLASVVHLIEGQTCDNLGVLLYEDLACNPRYNHPEDSCPTSYQCEGLQVSSNKCFFRGRSYEVGEVINRNDSSLCDVGCNCVSGGRGSSRFSCAQFGCQNWAPLRNDCYWRFSLDACCADGTLCPKPGQEITRCLVDNKQYKEGEIFFPKDSCYRCVCKPGFEGKYEEPYCRRIDCGVQTRKQEYVQKKCAPLYYDDRYRNNDTLCCPKDWLCSDGTEIIFSSNFTDKCSFGDKTLNVGDYFEKKVLNFSTEGNFKCECLIPPLLTCKEIKK